MPHYNATYTHWSLVKAIKNAKPIKNIFKKSVKKSVNVCNLAYNSLMPQHPVAVYLEGSKMKFKFNDGGRQAAGYKGMTGDCVARSIAIASSLPYADVYAALAKGTGNQPAGKRGKRSATASKGISVTRKWFKDYMASIGFVWTPTMGIGTGCKVHLHDGELPMGRLIVSVSKHYTAVIDGVINDTWNPQRETYWASSDGIGHVSRRCVYGYWSKQ